jgi:predicted RNA-binding Zn ribbon-like protein
VRSARSRADTIPLIAGRPVLDLVNTISWRGEPARREDHLRGPADCLTWTRRAGVLSDDETDELRRRLDQDPRAGRILVAGLRLLRIAVAETIVPPVTAPPGRVEPLILDALSHSHLVAGAAPHDGYRWRVTDLDEHSPRRRLTLDLLDLLSSPRGRLGVCADSACRWAFLDTSRAQNRQWCSSRDCGNRHRVRRHQAAASTARSRAGGRRS